ncbi:hypothetical protein EOM71_00540 [Candidatus Falkowbacteria bacterium]|nr:hypothetical protein [Candidatus Falkowbacteria bacterium]
MKDKIKVIGFDYGGVIEINTFKPISKIVSLLDIDKEAWSEAYFSLNHLCNKAGKSWEDVVLLAAKSFTNSETILKKVAAILLKNKQNNVLNQELLTFIKGSLKSKYKIALLSNYSKQLRDRLKEQKIANIFDYIIISGEVGYQKPEKDFFKTFFTASDIKPEEFIFIDDTKKSLESSEEIGYTPILFTNTKETIKYIQDCLKN